MCRIDIIILVHVDLLYSISFNNDKHACPILSDSQVWLFAECHLCVVCVGKGLLGDSDLSYTMHQVLKAALSCAMAPLPFSDIVQRAAVGDVEERPISMAIIHFSLDPLHSEGRPKISPEIELTIFLRFLAAGRLLSLPQGGLHSTHVIICPGQLVLNSRTGADVVLRAPVGNASLDKLLPFINV